MSSDTCLYFFVSTYNRLNVLSEIISFVFSNTNEEASVKFFGVLIGVPNAFSNFSFRSAMRGESDGIAMIDVCLNDGHKSGYFLSDKQYLRVRLLIEDLKRFSQYSFVVITFVHANI